MHCSSQREFINEARRVRRHHNHCEPFHFPYCLFCHFHLLFFANTFTFFFHFSFLSISIHPKEILLMRREGWGAITITSSPFTFLIQPPRAMFRKCSQPFGGVNKNLLFSEKPTKWQIVPFFPFPGAGRSSLNAFVVWKCNWFLHLILILLQSALHLWWSIVVTIVTKISPAALFDILRTFCEQFWHYRGEIVQC